MKVRFACFRGISLTSKLIKFWTRGEYSHIAYMFNFKDRILIETWNNECWSYTLGYENHLPDTPVEIWSKEISPSQYIVVNDFFRNLVKDKTRYDWMGILGFILFKNKDNPEKYFCSEACTEALVEAEIWPSLKANRIHPSYFVDLLKVSGFKLEVKEVIE